MPGLCHVRGGLTVLGALSVAGALAVSAAAQPAPVPVQVVQSSDGTLYVLQGDRSWTLVPNQIADTDAAALNPGGEIVGFMPNDLFVVQAPAPPPAAAPAASPAAQQPAPAAPPAAAPITGTADLTGKAGDDVATATPIAVGATISSVLDRNTKPHDVFSIALTGGTSYQLFPNTTNHMGGAGAITAFVLNPDTSAALQWTLGGGCGGCGGGFLDDKCYPSACLFTPAASGTYYLKIDATGTGQKYRFTIKSS